MQHRDCTIIITVIYKIADEFSRQDPKPLMWYDYASGKRENGYERVELERRTLVEV